MSEASQWVLGPIMVIDLQEFKVKSMKKVSFSKEKWKLKIWQLESIEPLEILKQKLIEKLPTLIQTIRKNLWN